MNISLDPGQVADQLVFLRSELAENGCLSVRVIIVLGFALPMSNCGRLRFVDPTLVAFERTARIINSFVSSSSFLVATYPAGAVISCGR